MEKIKITNDEELKYIMKFYGLTRVHIYEDGQYRGYLDENCSYNKGDAFRYFNKYGISLAHSLAYEQINNAISLKNTLHEPFVAVVLDICESDTWYYPDYDGGAPTHHVYPRKTTEIKELTYRGTKDEVFEKLEKANNRLRYCNGNHLEFKDKYVQQEYRLWQRTIPESRSFDLYYDGGIVD